MIKDRLYSVVEIDERDHRYGAIDYDLMARRELVDKLFREVERHIEIEKIHSPIDRKVRYRASLIVGKEEKMGTSFKMGSYSPYDEGMNRAMEELKTMSLRPPTVRVEAEKSKPKQPNKILLLLGEKQ